MASQQQSSRAAARARRELQVNGKGRSAAASAPSRQPNRRERKPVPVVNPAPALQAAAPVVSGFTATATATAPQSMPRLKPVQKSASRLRRESLAARGKSADRSSDRQRTQDMLRSAKKAVEVKKGSCGCGGACCQDAEATAVPVSALNVPTSSGVNVAKRRRVVNASDTGRMLSRARRTAMAGRGKAGLEAHSKGNSSASLARQANPDISGRDLARVVRESRSKSGSRGSSGVPTRTRRPRNAAEAKAISGTKVGHTEKLTGDEAGLCHSGVTGTDYMASEVFEKFCQGEAPKAPKKVESSETLSGSKLTSGGKVGSADKLTGVESGSCREVTGTEYLGREHFAQQCETTPEPSVAKVSHSQTSRGTVISGPKSSRSDKVSGNERGTCKAISGTPYAGEEVFESFCTTQEQRETRMRSVMPEKGNVGKDISGLQPGLTGKQMTGAEDGACQSVSGTPYLAASEVKEVCGAEPAQVGEADFPQSLVTADVVAGEFSVVPTVASATEIEATGVVRNLAPAAAVSKGVTGSGYDGGSSVTGAFSMGKGKVSGTEDSRLGTRSGNVITVETKSVESEVQQVSRVTGEGIETGLNITGDDWDRGDHVTGTEGNSAKRNPTRRGPMSAMHQIEQKRDPQIDRPSANVTGGSGGSQGTSSVTVSGGARG